MQDNYWFDVNYEALFNVDHDSGIKYVCGCGIAEWVTINVNYERIWTIETTKMQNQIVFYFTPILCFYLT